MTTTYDILGRPPARKPRDEEPDTLPDTDWRGEHHWKIQRNEGLQRAMPLTNIMRKSAKARVKSGRK